MVGLRSSVLLGAALLVLVFSSAVFGDDEAVESEKDAARKEYPAVYERTRTVIRYEDDGTATTLVEQRVRIETEAGRQLFGQVSVPYRHKSMSARFLSVRVIKPGGEVVETPLFNVQEVTSQPARIYPMFTDLRHQVIPVSGLEVGDTLEFSVERSIDKPLVPGEYFEIVNRISHLPVLSETISVDLPAERDLALDLFGTAPTEVAEKNGRVVRRWELNDFEPTDTPVDPVIAFSTFTTWEEFGAWYRDLLTEPMKVTPELRAFAESLVEGVSDPEEKVGRIYKYVAQSIRYVSISFGVGAYQPHRATLTYANLYCDCKDKHALLAALLSAVGLEASPVLVNIWFEIDKDVPSPLQFNHMISKVTVGDKTIWVDSTNEVAPMGVLVPGMRGNEVLVIYPDTASLERIPDSGPVPNMVIREWDAVLDETGDVEGEVHISMSGLASLTFRALIRQIGKDKVDKILQLMNMENAETESRSDLMVSDPGDISNPLTFDYGKKVRRFFDPTERTSRIPIESKMIRDLNWNIPEELDEGEEPVNDEAGDPIHLGGPMYFEEKTSLSLPEGVSVSLPEGLKIRHPFATYVSRYEMKDRRLVVTRDLEVHVREVSADQVGVVREMKETIKTDLKQGLAFERDSDVDLIVIVDRLSAFDLAKAAVREVEAHRHEKAEALVEEAEKKGPESAQAWNLVGWTHEEIGNPKSARRAYTAALELEPDNEYALKMMARLISITGTPEERLELSKRRSELNPADTRVLLELAATQIELGNLAAAESTFLQVVKNEPDNAIQWVALGAVRLRQGLIEKSHENFQKALEIDRAPIVYSNIARALAESDTDLDLAYNYASSAVTRILAEVKLLTSVRGWRQSLEMQSSLAVFLDTLGIVELKRGNALEAFNLLKGAHRLSRWGEFDEHALQAAAAAGKFEQALMYYGAIAMKKSAVPFGKQSPIPMVEELQEYVDAEIGDSAALQAYLVGKTRELLTTKGNCWPSEGEFTAPRGEPRTKEFRSVGIVLLIGPSGEIVDALAVNESEPWKSHALAEVRRVPWVPLEVGGETMLSLRAIIFTYTGRGAPKAFLVDEIFEYLLDDNRQH